MPNVEWTCRHFHALTPDDVYSILKLRNEVFVVEQNCVFQDADNKDQKCYHLMGKVEDNLAAYARLVPSGVSYEYISIGRIVTSLPYRSKGLGKALLNTSIAQCGVLFGERDIKIGAQLYLKNFYEGFGFLQTSDIYDEDGIDHIEMIRKISLSF